jgi:two-component system sensor histidine kinase BaeS
MRRRLFWSILGTAAAALAVVAMVGAVVTRIGVVRETRSEIARQAQAIAGLLEEAVAIDGQIGTRRMLELIQEGQTGSGDEPADRYVRILTSAQRMSGGLVDVGWIGRDGDLRLLRNPGLSSALGLDTVGLAAGERQFGRIQLPDETQALEAVAYPMEAGNVEGIVPVVVVGRRSDLIDWGRIMRGMLVPLALAALLSAVAAQALSRWLGRRLSGLAGAAHEIAGGDLAIRAEEEGDDEIADLAGSFNEMARRLEVLQRRERDFLMSVGHDLRTPLTTIGGYAEALEEGGLSDEETERIGGVVGRETHRLHRLVEDLMLLARLESREFTLRPESVDVAAHLQEVVRPHRSRAEAARIGFDLDIDETGLFAIDPDRLAQIVTNLTENAMRYTPEAGRMKLAVARRGETIELSVTNTGPGIDPGDLPRVFEKFYVARTYRRLRPEGSGLGLAIVHQLVRAMGGTVSVESDPGEVTSFTVVLPAMVGSPN